MKVARALLVLLIPFLTIWVTFLATGFAFNPRDIFTSNVFWGFSIIYWTFLCPVIFVIFEHDDK